MPYDYNSPNPPIVPVDQRSRGGSGGPSIEDLPFSLAPVLPMPTEQALSADPHAAYGNLDPAVQTASLRGWARPRSGQGATSPIPQGPFDSQTQTDAVKAWWDYAVRGHHGLADFTRGLLRGIISHLDGLGDPDALRRCLEAAAGSTEDWENFCRTLGSGQNNVVGGESERRACWSKTYQPRTDKINWCNGQFGDGIPTSD
jgi:hypothetical protein